MRILSALLTALAILPASAAAQQPPPSPPAPSPAPASSAPASSAPASSAPASSAPESVSADRREYTNDQKNAHYIGHVEIERSDGKIYADDVVMYGDENKSIATGNVLFAQGNNRLSAERAEFDTKTGLGTFFNAWGIASVQPPRQQARPGVAIPQMVGQETNVYFFGDKIEKIGPKKYKITNGGFSTCVQPTPRWELHADTVTLNLDHYTLLRNAVFSVKGVPMLYTPFLYYPTKRENRATGFLIPTYGTSTIRGHSIHDAFFWAIDRSQDATFFHDWFSKTGQGVGSEYRYNMGDGSDGSIRAYLLDQHETTYAQPGGTPTLVPAQRSYEFRGGVNQVLPGNLRARARIDYFSSIQSNQTFNTNIYDISRNQRTVGGNLVGAWGSYSLNGTFDHSEYFSPYAKGSSVVSGTWPRVTFSRNERPLLGSPLYFSVGTDVAHVLSNSTATDENGVVTEFDRGLTRLDVAPQIRYPFKKWQWFTVNSTTLWRDTYYTRSFELPENPNDTPSKPIDKAIHRPVFSVQSQIVGPVFNRIWDTPDNGYAEKFKHTIEPFLTLQWTAPVENFNQIITFDGIDSYVGGAQYNYGLNNRFFAKRTLAPGTPAQAREFISVELTQSYYTDQRASQLDRQYSTGQIGTAPTHFSPLSLSVRALPTNDINATVRAEFDAKYKELRTISAQGSYSWSLRLQTSVGWTKNAFIAELPQFNDPKFLTHYINASTNVHTQDNRVGGVYSLNYDVLNSTMTNQRISAFYNAQCCGIAFEYQIYNYGSASYFTALPQDRRFFLSFTLAGLGNFSPMNGALGGVPR
ncbi:MAG TPA: LPS assembly protein LptD [Vicinamibacterales bacterium]|jgi:LPS-assembly protein|nr:LPS assembly protein LptD [Vicinamibacterales bacterium]